MNSGDNYANSNRNYNNSNAVNTNTRSDIEESAIFFVNENGFEELVGYIKHSEFVED